MSDQLLKPIMTGQDLAGSTERAALAGPPLTQRRRLQHGLPARRDRALVSYASVREPSRQLGTLNSEIETFAISRRAIPSQPASALQVLARVQQ